MKKKLLFILSFIFIILFIVIAINPFKKSITDYPEINVIIDENGNICDSDFDMNNIISVPYINQNAYPTGCESVSTVMALNYMGINMTVDEFIDNYLDKEDLEKINGVYYGQSPENYFIGNPREKSGLGCYSTCIFNACNKFVDNTYTIKNLKNTDFNKLTEYIDKNIPVIVWITISLKEPVFSRTWIIKDSNIPFVFLGNEHCALLVGYDDIYYYFNDPLSGIVAYRKDIVEQRYIQMGKNAVVIE